MRCVEIKATLKRPRKKLTVKQCETNKTCFFRRGHSLDSWTPVLENSRNMCSSILLSEHYVGGREYAVPTTTKVRMPVKSRVYKRHT